MKVKVISCQIFEVYLTHLMKITKSDHSFDVEYLEIDRHNEPKELKKDLQKVIDQVEGYDLIMLIYGICGNSTSGLIAREIKVAIPRVHDCATILLGSKKRFGEVFGHRPSQGWKSVSYDKGDIHDVAIESNPIYQEYLEKYGEDNALYLFEMLFPVSENELYISLDMKEDEEKIKALSDDVEIVKGSLEYLINLLSLNFDDVLVLDPGEKVIPVYDFNQVIKK